MTPARRALWYIETHFAAEITLDDVADVAGVSRFHLARAFLAVTGQPVLRYVRGRRLTEAARALADGAPDILSVALEAGYASHEAFTRAFRDQFSLTPEQVRRRGLANLALVEPFKMTSTPPLVLDEPRFLDGPELKIVGLNARYGQEASREIPAQWQRFVPHIGHIPNAVEGFSYGVIHGFDPESSEHGYLCGVEVRDFSGAPDDLFRLTIPPHRYAVFEHTAHISAIGRTFVAIFDEWLPKSGFRLHGAPNFERYDERRFNPHTGEGGLEIWIAVTK